MFRARGARGSRLTPSYPRFTLSGEGAERIPDSAAARAARLSADSHFLDRQMKTHISFRDVTERQPLRTELARQAAKFDRQLKKFDPDLLDLHVSLERRTRRGDQCIASVTLHLPMGQLHASEEAAHSVVALKHACAQLIRELKRFKARLRGDHKRRRARRLRRRATL